MKNLEDEEGGLGPARRARGGHQGHGRQAHPLGHRQAEGIEPACAKACPTDCQVFGERDQILEMAHKAKQRLVNKGRSPVIYGEKELGTGTKKIYVLPEPLDLYPDILKSPKVSEDLGFFHQMLKPLGALTLTASVVGMVLGRMKEVKEKDKVKPS